MQLFKHLSHPPAPWLERLSLLGVGVGILIRIVHYLSNRSLWFDEVALGLNLLDRSYWDLLNALDHNQAAPPLFLWVEKFFIQIGGTHEYVLRFFPLLGGLLSLVLYSQLTKRFACGWARPIALWLFAIQGYIVYFASETKPYSWDVAIGLGLFMIVMRLDSIKPGPGKLSAAGISGALSIWLSYPSIFVMAGVEGANLVKLQLWKESGQQIKAFLRQRIPLYSVWIGSLCGLYFGVIQKTLTGTGLSDSWAGRYPDSWFNLLWLLDSISRFFYRPMGFSSPADGIAIVAFITGLACLYRTQKLKLLYLISPFVANLAASYLHKYPFRERLVLFLVPYGLIILAEGIVFWLSRWNKRPKVLGLISLIMVVGLILMPTHKALRDALQPGSLHFDHVRPAMKYIRQQWQPGDQLYVFFWTGLQFDYYNRRLNFPEADTIVSDLATVGINKLESDDLDQYEQELTELKNGPLQGEDRVWILLGRKKPSAEDAIAQRLNQIATPLERKQYPGAMVGLYDFSSSN